MPGIHLNVKRSAHAMSMCHWRHVTCDIHLEGDLRKYIIAIIPSECMISAGGITKYKCPIKGQLQSILGR